MGMGMGKRLLLAVALIAGSVALWLGAGGPWPDGCC